MNANPARSFARRNVQDLEPYVPGEQPAIKDLVKLNTNENPYPPAPQVLKAIRQAVDERLRLYPNPTAQALREKLAQLHRCKPANIIIGNGSDELLAMAVRAFVEPGHPSGSAWVRRPSRVQLFDPSYSLYPVLVNIHGALHTSFPLNPDFSLPTKRDLRRSRLWDFRAPLTFITTPNAPSGAGYSTASLEALCRAQKGVVVLDEAYVDFARQNALELALKRPNVIVSRTFSKAYSLCFQRVGYFVAHPELIGALDKVRDSYNVNGLGQIAALATLDHLPYYRARFKQIIASREKLTEDLRGLGFKVLPSETNFILARPPTATAAEWLKFLRDRKILVRWFDAPATRLFLRITIGTAEQMDHLVKTCREILGHDRKAR